MILATPKHRFDRPIPSDTKPARQSLSVQLSVMVRIWKYRIVAGSTKRYRSKIANSRSKSRIEVSELVP